jgi:hypothetical protein
MAGDSVAEGTNALRAFAEARAAGDPTGMAAAALKLANDGKRYSPSNGASWRRTEPRQCPRTHQAADSCRTPPCRRGAYRMADCLRSGYQPVNDDAIAQQPPLPHLRRYAFPE